MRRISATAGVLVVIALATAGVAEADQRFASPTGMKELCTSENKCSLKTAVEKANETDEVIVTPGEYDLSSTTIFAGVPNISIHGQAGEPTPTLVVDGASYGFSLEGQGSVLSDVAFRREGSGEHPVQCVGASTIERISVLAKGESVFGIYVSSGCTLRDSLLRADGKKAIGIFASGVSAAETSLRNLTVLASGAESTGLRAFGSDFGGGAYVVDVRNSIFAGEGVDLLAQTGFGTSLIRPGNSNFDSGKGEEGSSVVDAGGNQTAAPQFVNAAGDFREAAGSPTIDAGAADPALGALALGGEARVLGPAPDIGAYETTNPAPPAAEIQSLAVKPAKFKPVNAGGAVTSRKKKTKAKIGATVSFALSGASSVSFTVQRKTVKKRKGKKRKVVFKPVKGGFSVDGKAGANSFKFSGRIDGKGLKPGSYRLLGTTGPTVKKATFKIVK